jgi:serine/threonine protein kinase
VYDAGKYDATAVDIWSLAIIFCCMTLRRFPWKQPRLTDNSYKLFAADPSPGHDPNKLIMPISKSTNDLSSIPARDIDFEEERRKSTTTKVEPQDEKKPDSSSKQPAATATDGTKPTTGTGEKKEQIRGPWRILRLLPRESRHVISRMLVIDPKKRAKMDEILADEWVANTVICRQEAPGIVINADDHTHILKPPAEYTGTPAK